MSAYLDGLHVLDLSRLLPGPYASLMLAEMGADVVKLEDSKSGDYARNIPPMIGETSALYLALNRGKRNLAVDLRSKKGTDTILRLIQKYDVVLEGFRPGIMEKMGLGYETLKKHNPSVILCSLTGYGQDGPYHLRAGHDLNYQSLTGMVEMTGNKGEAPGIPGTQVADLAAGSQAAVLAIMAAVLRRMRTGEGAHLDVAMCDNLVSMQPITMLEVFAGDTRPVRGDTILQGRYICYNIYETKDGGFMSLGALEPKFFMNFCMAIDRPDLMTKHFASADPDSEAYGEMIEIFKSRTLDEWVNFLRDVDACCEPVLNPTDIEHHPHLKTRDLFFTIQLDNGSKLKQVVTVPALKDCKLANEAAAPLGTHSLEVLEGSGFSKDDLDRMIEEKVIATS